MLLVISALSSSQCLYVNEGLWFCFHRKILSNQNLVQEKRVKGRLRRQKNEKNQH